MNKEAFLAGYLNKEANWWEDTKRGWDALTTREGRSDIKTGIGIAADDMKHSFLDKVLPGQLGTRKGRAEASRFIKDPEKYIKGRLKPHVEKARKEIKGGIQAATGVGAATTLATGLMTNMAAQGRHKQLMQALRNRRSPAASMARPASPGVFRLSTPAARARQGY
jgi:hypothetical protein